MHRGSSDPRHLPYAVRDESGHRARDPERASPVESEQRAVVASRRRRRCGRNRRRSEDLVSSSTTCASTIYTTLYRHTACFLISMTLPIVEVVDSSDAMLLGDPLEYIDLCLECAVVQPRDVSAKQALYCQHRGNGVQV